jgi:hypothetical protein
MAKRIMQEKFLKWADGELCSNGSGWLRSNKLTPRQAWDQCQRPAWMLWPLYILDIERLGGAAHKAAFENGFRHYDDYAKNPKACAAIRKAIPWRRIAKRLAEVIGD